MFHTVRYGGWLTVSAFSIWLNTTGLGFIFTEAPLWIRFLGALGFELVRLTVQIHRRSSVSAFALFVLSVVLSGSILVTGSINVAEGQASFIKKAEERLKRQIAAANTVFNSKTSAITDGYKQAKTPLEAGLLSTLKVGDSNTHGPVARGHEASLDALEERYQRLLTPFEKERDAAIISANREYQDSLVNPPVLSTDTYSRFIQSIAVFGVEHRFLSAALVVMLAFGIETLIQSSCASVALAVRNKHYLQLKKEYETVLNERLANQYQQLVWREAKRTRKSTVSPQSEEENSYEKTA